MVLIDICTCADYASCLYYCDIAGKHILVDIISEAVYTVLSCNCLAHNLCLATWDLRSLSSVLYQEY